MTVFSWCSFLLKAMDVLYNSMCLALCDLTMDAQLYRVLRIAMTRSKGLSLCQAVSSSRGYVQAINKHKGHYRLDAQVVSKA